MQKHGGYENYTATSRNYDKTRVPLGLHICERYLGLRSQEKAHLRVLDAGCASLTVAPISVCR